MRALTGLVLVLSLAGCELVADFDRGKIPQPHRDAGRTGAAGSDTGKPPADDAATPNDGGEEADAGH
jgi:hypothetical protein